MNLDRLNSLLFSRGMSKVQLAERCRVSRTTIDNILSGEDAKMSNVQRLADALGVRVGYLFDESADAMEQLLSDIQELQKENEALRRRKAARVTVELDLDEGELAASGLKKKIIARLKEQ